MKSSLSLFFQNGFNAALFRRLPACLGYYLMQIFGRLYYLVRSGERRRIKANIRDMLGWDRTSRELERTVQRSFRGIFLHYFEKLFAAYRPFAHVKRFVMSHFEVEGIEILDEALARGKGGILATAHFGAVEFIPWVVGLQGYALDVIMECATDRLRAALDEKTQYLDVRLYSSTDGQSVLFRALRSLAENRLLMTECDEVDAWHRRRNRRITLFGRELYFDQTLNLLARRSGAPVIGAFLRRTGFLKYKVAFEDVSVVRSTDNVARDTMVLWEKYVSREPEQWYQWKKWQEMKVAWVGSGCSCEWPAGGLGRAT